MKTFRCGWCATAAAIAAGTVRSSRPLDWYERRCNPKVCTDPYRVPLKTLEARRG